MIVASMLRDAAPHETVIRVTCSVRATNTAGHVHDSCVDVERCSTARDRN